MLIKPLVLPHVQLWSRQLCRCSFISDGPLGLDEKEKGLRSTKRGPNVLEDVGLAFQQNNNRSTWFELTCSFEFPGYFEGSFLKCTSLSSRVHGVGSRVLLAPASVHSARCSLWCAPLSGLRGQRRGHGVLVCMFSALLFQIRTDPSNQTQVLLVICQMCQTHPV